MSQGSGYVVGGTVESCDLEGTAAHAGVAEENGTQGTIVQPPQVREFTGQAGDGQYRAGKNHRVIPLHQGNLAHNRQLPVWQTQQFAFRWQGHFPALVKPPHAELPPVLVDQAPGEGSVIQQPAPHPRRQLTGG